MKQTKVGRINKNSAIHNSEVYEYLAHHKISFETLTAEDAEEFKARAKASADGRRTPQNGASLYLHETGYSG